MASKRKKAAVPAKKGLPAVYILAAVYLGMVLIRYLLAVNTHIYSTVIIDEHLYYSIARSIANGEGLLFMGQPADYTSILYPLVIAPVYRLFPEGTAFFRLIQLWNICLMNLSIIPLYLISSRIIRDRRTAIAAAVISMMMPDMVLGGFIMSEAILFPLIYTMMYFAYRYFADKRAKDLLTAGVIGGLIFFTKPGQAVIAGVILGAALIGGLRARDRRQILAGIWGLAGFAATVALSCAIVFGLFRHPSSLLGVYDYQTFKIESVHWGAFFRAVLLSPACFYLICGGVCLVLPILRCGELEPEKRTFLWVVLISALVIMTGTAWTVNQVEYERANIHTRYFAMLVPLLLILGCGCEEKKNARLPEHPEKDAKVWIIWGITGLFVLCAAVFGVAAGIDFSADIMGNAAMAFLRATAASVPAGILWTVLLSVGALVLAFCAARRRMRLRPLMITLTLISFLLNTAFSYVGASRKIDPSFASQAGVIREAVARRDFLYVYGNNRAEYNAYLDPNTRKSVCMVYVNDLFNNVNRTGGVYEPFMPALQRGTIPRNMTPDTDLFVIDKGAMSHLVLSDKADYLTEDSNLNMQIVRIPRGEIWADAFLAGPIGGEVSRDTPCYIRLFAEKYRQGDVKVTLELDLETDTEFIISAGDVPYSFTLPAGRDTYHVTLPPADMVSFQAKDCDMKVLSFGVSLSE